MPSNSESVEIRDTVCKNSFFCSFTQVKLVHVPGGNVRASAVMGNMDKELLRVSHGYYVIAII